VQPSQEAVGAAAVDPNANGNLTISQVQDAINQAQAAFAGVTESQAALQRAQIDAQADAARQSGYDSCPTCAQIDILKSLPSG